MRNKPDTDWGGYLAYLRELPFVRHAAIRVRKRQKPAFPNGAVAELILKVPHGEERLIVELKNTQITRASVDGLSLQKQRDMGQPRILFAPYVAPDVAGLLATRGVNYVDRVGNCRLQIGDKYLALVEGRKPEKPVARGRGLGVPGYEVLFAILARRELLNTTVRALAEAAGVGKTVAAETLAWLDKEGLVLRTGAQRRLLDMGVVLDRWLTGYTNIVRHRMLLGTYRTPDPNPTALEERIEKTLGETEPWAFGGTAAAMRLTAIYRGPKTVLHVASAHDDLARRLQTLPAEDGALTILRARGKVAFEGVAPKTVHPLLIYAELTVDTDPRAQEAALEIRERYIHL